MDPDPGGPKTCGSGFGVGSATLGSTIHFYPHLGLYLHGEIRHQELRHKEAGGQIHVPARLPIIEQRQGFVSRRHRRRRARPRFAPTERCGAAGRRGRLSGGGVRVKKAAEKMLEGEDLLLVEVELEAGQAAGEHQPRPRGVHRLCGGKEIKQDTGVADPGCLSRIPDPNFFRPGFRIRIFSIRDPYFFHPGSEFFHPGSRMPDPACRIPDPNQRI